MILVWSLSTEVAGLQMLRVEESPAVGACGLRRGADAEKIVEVDEEHKHRCGIERILWELQEDGLMTSQRRVRRLARAAGVECVHPRPYVRTTLPDAQAQEGAG